MLVLNQAPCGAKIRRDRMKLPIVPTINFEGKAVFVLQDAGYPLGFVEKCPLIAVGEPFLLPNGENAGTVIKVNFCCADNELVASCSFKTDKWPFTFKVYADAKEVATYYQRTWKKRSSRQHIHTVKIKVDEVLLRPHKGYRYGKHLHGKVLAVYTRKELYNPDSFKAFIEKYPKHLTEETTVTLYGVNYKVHGFTYPYRYDQESKEVNRLETRIVMTKEEMKIFLANAKLAKHRWERYYIHEHTGDGFW